MDNKTRPCSVFNPDFSETVAYNNPLFPAYVVYGFLPTRTILPSATGIKI